MLSAITETKIKFRCPDCSGEIVDSGALTCFLCKRLFSKGDQVYDLLPKSLEAAKSNEDRMHQAEDAKNVWRRLVFNKWPYITQFERELLPELSIKPSDKFLEVGGGLCFSSALVKLQSPSTTVVATDVSPNYLRVQARRAVEIMQAPIDLMAAVDGENLPFPDNSFTKIFCNVVIYRVPNPVKMLKEIKRVLTPGGLFLGIDRAYPDIPHFYDKHSELLRQRAQSAGVAERGRRMGEWRKIVHEAGYPAESLRLRGGRFVKNTGLRRIKALFSPVPIEIRYTK